MRVSETNLTRFVSDSIEITINSNFCKDVEMGVFCFLLLHPDRNAIGIPVQKLDTIAALIKEHEQAAIAHIAMKVILDDAVETIEALAHIDGLAVQVDGNRRAESEHRDYATCSRISEMELIALNGTRRVTTLGSLISMAVDCVSVVWTLRKATLSLLSASLRFQ
jgi:hypothetical protein